jgi:hypothetical protein
MRMKSVALATSAFCAAAALSTAASAAGSFGVQYFEVPSNQGGDFGTCCSSPPATLPVVTLGSALGPDGLPVTTLAAALGGVIDQDSSGQILWWTASSATGISSTGSGNLPLPLGLTNMFAPNGTGSNNNDFFETAALSGVFTGNGATSITVTSDDDTFVYLDGHFVGGNLGVHANQTSVLDLGNLSGNHQLNVFYADRAQVGADLAITGVGLDTLSGTPEPASWAMMLMGFGGLGAVLRSRRNKLATAATA